MIFGTVWGMTLAQDGSGFYNEIAADLLDGAGAGVAYQLMPYRRAKARFLDGNGACIYPSAVDVIMAGGFKGDASSLVESAPLFETRTHIFARRGERAPTTLADLRGKTVAVPSGSVMRNILEAAGAELINVFDETDKARMLLTARVDYMTAMLPDAVLVFDALGEPLPAFDTDLVFLQNTIGVVCHRTPQTEAFIRQLNGRISALAGSRAYQTRLEEAGIWHPQETGQDSAAVVARAHPRATGLRGPRRED